MERQHSLPLGLRVLALMRERVPRLAWDPRAVLLVVEDYEHIIDVEEVAAECAHWLMTSGTRAKDGPMTLRGFCSKRKAQVAPKVVSLRGRRQLYSRASLRAYGDGSPTRGS